MDMSMNEEPTPEKAVDLSKMFDLSGDKKIAEYVQKFEELYRMLDAAKSDIKQLTDDAAQDFLTKKEIAAVKKVAKWRLDDKMGAAQETFGAIRRVSDAIKADLFGWNS